MIRDTSSSGSIVRMVFAEVVAMRLLAERVAAHPETAPALLDGIIADLKDGVADVGTALRDKKRVEGLLVASELPERVEALIKEILALKSA